MESQNKDCLKYQEAYVKSLYYDVDTLSLTERKETTKNQIIGLHGEIDEFVQAIKLLPWKSGQDDIDENNVKEELIDVYHFFMNLCALWGIRSQEELTAIYLKKNAINKARGKIHSKPTEGFKVN